MNLADWLSLGSLLTGIIQIVVGLAQFYPARSRRSISGSFLIVGAATGFLIAASLFWHPRTTAVGKPCSVTDQQTGDATTKGNQSPATTGDDNSVTYGNAVPAAPAKRPTK